MRNLGPEFIDITWGAGGKNADLTSSLVQVCQETIGLETCMHLTCTESEFAGLGCTCDASKIVAKTLRCGGAVLRPTRV